VVFVVSDGFCHDVQSRTTSNTYRTALCRYLYELMRSEFINNGCRHYRSIAVLQPRTNCANVPLWLKNTHLYLWPEQYKELFKIFHSHRQKLLSGVQ